jgi:hypothetical protein
LVRRPKFTLSYRAKGKEGRKEGRKERRKEERKKGRKKGYSLLIFI